MKYGSKILKIITYGLQHDDVKLRHYAEFLAWELDEDGEVNLAQYIRNAIDPEYKPRILYPQG